MSSSFLDAFRHALRRETTLAEAEQALGMGERGLSRRLAGARPFSVAEMIDVAERWDLDLYGVLADSGRLPEGLPDLARVMRLLGRGEPPDDETPLVVDRVIRKVGRTEPLDLAPDAVFHELEALRRRSRTAFDRQVNAYRRSVLSELARKRKYGPEDVRDLAQALDLWAKAVNVDVPLAMSILREALRLPLHDHSPSRLYLEDHACYLLRQAEHRQLSVAYRLAGLSKALLGDPEIAARMCMGLAASYDELKEKSLERRANLTALRLAPESPFAYYAAFNLAKAEVERDDLDAALSYLDRIDTDAVEDPQFVLRVVWLDAEVRARRGEAELAAVLYNRALTYRPAEQSPLNLLYLLADVLEAAVLPSAVLLEHLLRLVPFLSRLDSPAARRLVTGLLQALQDGREPEPIRPALDRLFR